MTHLFVVAALVALVAFTYSQILTAPDMLLNAAFNYADRYWPKWVAYPLIVCFKCVAGQLAFWYYLRHNWRAYDVEIHIVFVCLTIFLSLFITSCING